MYICVYICPETEINVFVQTCVYIYTYTAKPLILVILPIILSMRGAISHSLAQSLTFFPTLGSVPHCNQPNMHRLCHHSHPLATPWIKICTHSSVACLWKMSLGKRPNSGPILESWVSRLLSREEGIQVPSGHVLGLLTPWDGARSGWAPLDWSEDSITLSCHV